MYDKKIPLLKADEIEVKIKQVTANGAWALIYKTARVDMDYLDEVFGAMNWTSDYKEIRGALYCGIGVRSDDNDFVWKWDCGIESRADDEGNEKKGEASDAFKRAGFKWGIGRELYTSPKIFLRLPTTEKGGKYYLADSVKWNSYSVSEIGYDDRRNITKLVIINDKGEIVFTFGGGNAVFATKSKPQQAKEAKSSITPTATVSSDTTQITPEEHIAIACAMVVNNKGTMKRFDQLSEQDLLWWTTCKNPEKARAARTVYEFLFTQAKMGKGKEEVNPPCEIDSLPF